MTASFSQSSSFILNKAYFNECYSESVIADTSFRAYFKSIVLTLVGLALLLFTQITPYATWFIIALGLLEAVSVFYHQPWWVIRQMLSKASNSEVTLLIDDNGISTQSFYLSSQILWSDVENIQQTTLGFLIKHLNGRTYLSASTLSNSMRNFLLSKIKP